MFLVGGNPLIFEIIDYENQGKLPIQCVQIIGFEDMNQMYIRSCELFLLVYSVTDFTSFVRASELFEKIKKFSQFEVIPLVLAG